VAAIAFVVLALVLPLVAVSLLLAMVFFGARRLVRGPATPAAS